ncbi:hypothetical protein SO694_00019222 [Aureococcus anophagefferens]|uniref:Uncharacterized protein n=1 Tax=Aureococcus anophagefferens TaxID=44056 RepID=A0ABR1G0E0_AURAN
MKNARFERSPRARQVQLSTRHGDAVPLEPGAAPPTPLDENEDEVRWDGGGDGDFEARADDGGSQHLLELIGDLQAGAACRAGGTSQPRSSTSGLASMLGSPGVDDREIAR